MISKCLQSFVLGLCILSAPSSYACDLGVKPSVVADAVYLAGKDASFYWIDAHFAQARSIFTFAGKPVSDQGRSRKLTIVQTWVNIFYLQNGQWIKITPVIGEVTEPTYKADLWASGLTVRFGIPTEYIKQLNLSRFRVLMNSYDNDLCAATPEFQLSPDETAVNVVTPGN